MRFRRRERPVRIGMKVLLLGTGGTRSGWIRVPPGETVLDQRVPGDASAR
jgi:hypothetical protein